MPAPRRYSVPSMSSLQKWLRDGWRLVSSVYTESGYVQRAKIYRPGSGEQPIAVHCGVANKYRKLKSKEEGKV